jgi:hypothetical protein
VVKNKIKQRISFVVYAEPNFKIFIVMNISKLKGQVPDSIYKEIPYMAE